MKIAFVTPWEETVPPKKYGGIELVVYNIVEELITRGHEVVLLGTGDSQTRADLVEVFPTATRGMTLSTSATAREANTFIGVSRVLEKLQWIDADIVHNHLGWQMLIFERLIRQPVVTTLHLPLDETYSQHMYHLAPQQALVSISHSQRRPLPDINYIDTVYNGIRVEEFDFRAQHEGYLVFLGSFTAHKGPDKAIDIAKRTNHQLIMAGKIDPLEVDYFETKIRPHIDGKQIQFIGEVDHAQKNKLLGGAKAFLMPISWNEPFGLVVVEAMACGAPVIATNLGAMPEIIDHGVNGFLCADVDEMVERIGHIDRLDRAMARRNVEDNFSVKRMVDGYERVYEHVLDHYHSQPKPLNKVKKIRYRAKKTFGIKHILPRPNGRTGKKLSHILKKRS